MPSIDSSATVSPEAPSHRSGIPTWRAVLILAWPVLAQQFLILTVGLSDQILAGRFEPVSIAQRAEAVGHQMVAVGLLGQPGSFGVAAAVTIQAPLELNRQLNAPHVAFQAAQTTANYLAWFLASYPVFVTVGSTALVGRFIGAGDRASAIHATNQSLLLAVLFGGLATPILLAILHPALWLLQLRGDAAILAADYLWPLLALLVFQMVELTGIACLVGAGDTLPGLWVLGGVAIINVPLAWLFFHGFGLGFSGIALGTALSHVVGAVAVLLLLYGGRAGLRLSPHHMWPDLPLLRRLLRISVPSGLDGMSNGLGQLWFISIVNGLGYVASTAHGIAIRWEGMGYLSGAAFGTAAMTLVAQDLGAQRPDRARYSGWVAFALGGGVMATMGAVFFILAPEMFGLICPNPDQKPVIDVGVPVLRLVAFAMPALAATIIFTSALRGAGDTRVPVLFTWFGFLAVRIPLAYLLTQPSCQLGLLGAWLAMFADILVRGGFFLARFAGGRWQTLRV
jgi:putative MATE family efflux protein